MDETDTADRTGAARPEAPTQAGESAEPAIGSPAAAAAQDDALKAALGDALSILETGGPVAAALLLMSLVAAAIVFAKLLAFRRAGLGEATRALAAAERFRAGDAAQVPASAHPAAEIVALAAAARAAGRRDADAVRAELERLGRARLAELRSHFRALELIASLAPLLGLFGTVLGMIDAFRALERSAGAVDPGALSGGIWTALLTTALGLGVAMPTVAALGLLERRVERAAGTMEDALTRVTAPPIAPAAAERIPMRRAERSDAA